MSPEEQLDYYVYEMCNENMRSKTFRSKIPKTIKYTDIFEKVKELLKGGVDIKNIRPNLNTNIFTYCYILELFDVVEEMIKYLDLSDGMSASYHTYNLNPFLYTLWLYSDMGLKNTNGIYSHPDSLYQKYKLIAPPTELRVFRKCIKNSEYCMKFADTCISYTCISDTCIYNTSLLLESRKYIPIEYNITIWKAMDSMFSANVSNNIMDYI